jgi:hypothetical protein
MSCQAFKQGQLDKNIEKLNFNPNLLGFQPEFPKHLDFQDIDYFLKTHHLFNGSNATKLRTLFYPPLKDDQVRGDVVRCGAHSDYGTITFLYQVKKTIFRFSSF